MANKKREKAQRMASRGASVQEIKKETGLSGQAARTVSNNYNPSINPSPLPPPPRMTVQQAVSNAGNAVNINEYNQILRIAGDAMAAAKAIAKSGVDVRQPVQQAINESVVPAYDLSTEGGAGLGMKDVKNLMALGVDKAGIKQAAAAAPFVTNNVYNAYKTGVTGEMLAIQEWTDSVNAQNQQLIDAVNQQVVSNQVDNTDWINQLNMLTSSIAATQQQQEMLQGPQGAYAVVTGQNAPAAGAKTTSAITPRRKPSRNPLSISPAMSSSAGAGLNIAA